MTIYPINFGHEVVIKKKEAGPMIEIMRPNNFSFPFRKIMQKKPAIIDRHIEQ